jgi:hypothetical protein
LPPQAEPSEKSRAGRQTVAIPSVASSPIEERTCRIYFAARICPAEKPFRFLARLRKHLAARELSYVSYDYKGQAMETTHVGGTAWKYEVFFQEEIEE